MMFDNSSIDKETYFNLMYQIKCMNSENKKVKKSRQYKIGLVLTGFLDNILAFNFKELKKHTILVFNNIRYRKKGSNNVEPTNAEKISNYFSNERIAIYTCIFGNYDVPAEPLYKPDNCDYYIITDQEVSEESIWKKVDINKFSDILKGLSNAEKNRYFKMHPHIIFEDYRYSIYVDGNIKIYTDLTEYIYDVTDIGLATHLHSKRNCVYDECAAVVKIGKEKKENIQKYIEFLKEEGMPKNYGLLECNVLVRDHKNSVCVKLMEEWWEQFKNKIKRDQLSLPYLLYKKKIDIKKVGTLGNDVFLNPSFRILRHEDSKL